MSYQSGDYVKNFETKFLLTTPREMKSSTFALMENFYQGTFKLIYSCLQSDKQELTQNKLFKVS